jgi:predicted nucleotidyltransferase component of viral defense system
MIRKQDILDRVAEWHLRPEVVEKDYVLGWLLAALGAHPETAAHWVFKGGTCIKKCFAETYRFSEDLDFTLRSGAIYDEEGLRAVVRQVAATAGEASGIVFLVNDIVVRTRQNRRGERTFEARLGYRGPLDNPAQPKVRFDLSRYEAVVLPTERRSIFHPYPDSLPSDAAAVCYAFDEVLAEKTRALIERTRPRDLYDVVLILDDHVGSLDLRRAREVLLAKCEAKGIALPTAAGILELVRDAAELASGPRVRAPLPPAFPSREPAAGRRPIWCPLARADSGALACRWTSSDSREPTDCSSPSRTTASRARSSRTRFGGRRPGISCCTGGSGTRRRSRHSTSPRSGTWRSRVWPSARATASSSRADPSADCREPSPALGALRRGDAALAGRKARCARGARLRVGAPAARALRADAADRRVRVVSRRSRVIPVLGS